jgi:hypothetical protein
MCLNGNEVVLKMTDSLKYRHKYSLRITATEFRGEVQVMSTQKNHHTCYVYKSLLILVGSDKIDSANSLLRCLDIE